MKRRNCPCLSVVIDLANNPEDEGEQFVKNQKLARHPFCLTLP